MSKANAEVNGSPVESKNGPLGGKTPGNSNIRSGLHGDERRLWLRPPPKSVGIREGQLELEVPVILTQAPSTPLTLRELDRLAKYNPTPNDCSISPVEPRGQHVWLYLSIDCHRAGNQALGPHISTVEYQGAITNNSGDVEPVEVSVFEVGAYWPNGQRGEPERLSTFRLTPPDDSLRKEGIEHRSLNPDFYIVVRVGKDKIGVIKADRWLQCLKKEGQSCAQSR